MATFTVTENFGTYKGNTSYILDGDTSNCWQADAKQGSGKYVLVTASEPIHVNSVTYSTTNTSELFKTGAWLQISEDGQSFTDVEQFKGSTSQTFTVDADCQYIRIYCKSGSNYTSISELAIDWEEISHITYTVTVQKGSGITTDQPDTLTLKEKELYTVNIYGTVNTVTDNGTDVKDKLIEQHPQTGGDLMKYPASYSTAGNISGTRYRNCIGKDSSTTATGNDYASGSSSSTATISYTFDFSDIPEEANIDSVSVVVGGHAENASRSTATLQLYSGNTAKGSAAKFSSTSKQLVTLDAGSWTREELQNATLRFTIGYYGGLVNGVDFKVTYSMPSTEAYYAYTIASVTSDHIILINVGGSADTNLRQKVGQSYKKVMKVYRKTSGGWEEVKDIETIFITGTKFRKG